MTRIRMPYEKGIIPILTTTRVEDLRQVVRGSAGVVHEGVGISGYAIDDVLSAIHGGISVLTKEIHATAPRHPVFYRAARNWTHTQNPSLEELRDSGVTAVVNTFNATNPDRMASIIDHAQIVGIPIVFEHMPLERHPYMEASKQGISAFLVPQHHPMLRIVKAGLLDVSDSIFFTVSSSQRPVQGATLSLLGERWHVFMPDTSLRPPSGVRRRVGAIHDAAIEVVRPTHQE